MSELAKDNNFRSLNNGEASPSRQTTTPIASTIGAQREFLSKTSMAFAPKYSIKDNGKHTATINGINENT